MNCHLFMILSHVISNSSKKLICTHLQVFILPLCKLCRLFILNNSRRVVPASTSGIESLACFAGTHISKSSMVKMGTRDEQHNRCATGAGRMSALQRSLNNACCVYTWEERLSPKREVSLFHPTTEDNSVV